MVASEEVVLAAAETRVAALQERVDKLRAQEAADIAAAASSKTSVAEGYWKTRWAAEQQLLSAQRMLETARQLVAEASM